MIRVNKKNKIIPDSALGASQIAPKALSGKRGYSVLELLFYISFFAVISLVVINAMIIMAKSFKTTIIQAELIQSGNIMERMSREIRQAYDIDGASTSTNLKLNTKDDIGTEKTMEFKFVDSNIQLWDNGINIGNLNTPNIAITNIDFTQIVTVKGKAVKIVLTLKSNNDNSGETQDFYDTIVLRGAYEE